MNGRRNYFCGHRLLADAQFSQGDTKRPPLQGVDEPVAVCTTKFEDGQEQAVFSEQVEGEGLDAGSTSVTCVMAPAASNGTSLAGRLTLHSRATSELTAAHDIKFIEAPLATAVAFRSTQAEGEHAEVSLTRISGLRTVRPLIPRRDLIRRHATLVT